MPAKIKIQKRHKYGAIPTIVDGIRFASKKEAAHYTVLQARMDADEIRELTLQVKYPLHAHTPTGEKVRVGVYVADFFYIDNRTGKSHTIDVKGVKTPMYRWKSRHLKIEYGITIEEV